MAALCLQTRREALRAAGTTDEKTNQYGPPASVSLAQDELKKRLAFQTAFFDKLDNVIA